MYNVRTHVSKPVNSVIVLHTHLLVPARLVNPVHSKFCFSVCSDQNSNPAPEPIYLKF